jgi:fatty acid desaturase
MNRDRILWRGATLAVAIGAVALLGLVAGFHGTWLVPMGIGVATAVAVAGERGHSCSPRLFRRRN